MQHRSQCHCSQAGTETKQTIATAQLCRYQAWMGSFRVRKTRFVVRHGITFCSYNKYRKLFKKQKLVGVVFTEADISGCDFTDVEFEGCHLNGTTVSEETVFDGADLRGAYISSSHLDIASLTGAIMTIAQARDLLEERYGLVIVKDVV